MSLLSNEALVDPSRYSQPSVQCDLLSHDKPIKALSNKSERRVPSPSTLIQEDLSGSSRVSGTRRYIDHAKSRGYVSSLNLSEFLSSKTFPRTVEDGKLALEKAKTVLRDKIEKLLEIPDADRNFDNTVLAYHEIMTKFDAVERLVRSERILDDEAVGKQELLDKFVACKDEIFSDSRIQNMFIDYADRMLNEDILSSFQWQCLKGIINSIVPDKTLVTKHEGLKEVINARKCIPYTYLKGDLEPKKLLGKEKEFSYLTMNLCFMPETNSMIYGGLLPWPVRIDGIVEKIRRLNPDIVFLQEIYDVSAISELHKRLSQNYTHFYGNITPRLFGLSHESLVPPSGLAVISKFELTNLQFEPFLSITNDDKPSKFDRLKLFGMDRNYGVLHCVVEAGKTQLAHIATTHLNPFFADIRAKQVKQIVELFQSHANRKIPQILCGDINIERNDMNEEGERLIHKNFKDHYSSEHTNLEYGDYWHKHMRNVEKFVHQKHSPWTVDRSLLWSKGWASGDRKYTMKLERIILNDMNKPEEALSDHHGLLTRFKF